MSNEARQEVIKHSQQTKNRYHLMLAMAENASPGGYCCASVATLARIGHMSERTVQNLMPALTESGEVVLIDTGGGRARSTRYWITVGNLHPLAHEKGECSCTLLIGKGAEIGGKGASPEPEWVQKSAERVQLFAPETLETKTRKEVPPSSSLPVLNEPPETTTSPTTGKAQRKRQSVPESPDLQAVLALWQALGLGPVSQKAKGELRKLVAEHGREWVEHGLRQASAENIQWPVSWIRACIPGWKKPKATGPPATRAGPKPSWVQDSVTELEEYLKRSG